jgi:hypothetical protein
LLSQTILNSYPLDLKKSDGFSQILNAENEQTHEIFVFAADNENISILKYNTSLFLTDQFKASIKNLDDKSLIGYSFSEDGNPTLYWSTLDFSNILAVKCYFENKTSRIINFKFPSETQYVVAEFQQNNAFNILTKDISEQSLMLYTFKNGTAEEKTIDFSAFLFQDKNTKITTFNRLIKENPIEQIEVQEYNPLFKSTEKNKLYILPNRIVLTLDHDPKKTQLLDINLENLNIKEKKIPQPVITKAKKTSNSFFLDDKLYQISASEDELLMDVKDYDSSQILKSIKVSKNDTIKFKISPLVIQREGEKPKDLKTAKKFLNHISSLNVGLSVFKNNENTYITIGGTPKIIQPNILFSQFYDNFDFFGTDMGAYSPPGNYYALNFHSETVYFESALDRNYAFLNQSQLEPMAIDNISYFLSINKQITSDNILKFKDFYILGYYDTVSKQYVMRKFKDGFETNETFEPLNTPSRFSRPFPKNRH